MSYQDIYGTLNDSVGKRTTTSSRRGTVSWIDFDLNTFLGKGLEIRVRSEGNLIKKPRERVYHCNNKLQEYKDNPKKTLEWNKKLEEAEKDLQEQKNKELVRTEIYIKDDEMMSYYVDNVKIDKENINLLREILNNEELTKTIKEKLRFLKAEKNI